MKAIPACIPRVLRLFAAALLVAATLPPAGAQLLFEFSYGPGMVALGGSSPTSAAAIGAGVSAAGAKWSTSLFDPVTIKITVDLDPGLPSSVYAAASAVKVPTPYTSVKGALFGDALSATDITATGSLQPGPHLEAVTHDTSVMTGPSPEIRLSGGLASGVWNTTLSVTRANLKALGIIAGTDGSAGAEGTLMLNPAKFGMLDFSRGDGITPGLFDFTGIAIHEIGHLMGFVSGVDDVDFAGDGAPGNPLDLSGTAIFSVLDLYRYHDKTLDADTDSQPTSGAVNDWRFGPPPAGFPPLPKPFLAIDADGIEGVDGTATVIASFATGTEHGDGTQASHFAGGTAAVMTSFAPGTLANPTMIDLTAMDAIGWNTIAVPEPSSYAVVFGLVGFAGILFRRGRDQRNA